MKPLLTLKKHNSRIEAYQDNGLIRLSTVRAGKVVLNEYVIRKDMDSFIKFLESNGYEKV